MSATVWAKVEEALNAHPYMGDVARSVERVRRSAEVFTPSNLVMSIVQELGVEVFAPGRTVLDPACGDGQFLVAAKAIKVYGYEMSEPEALSDLYGVDIMADNVAVARARLGGGTLVVGDMLAPDRSVPGQTLTDKHLMMEIFGDMALGQVKRKRRGPDMTLKPASEQLELI